MATLHSEYNIPTQTSEVSAPEDWIYSNYLEWLGQRKGTLVDFDFIQEDFGSSAKYQELVTYFIKTRYLPGDERSYLNSLED